MVLRKILFPFSLIYALVVRIRNYLYDSGVLKTSTFPTKTICIGNLSTGGTGKTPMVEYLISYLTNRHKIAVLSRGYRRKSSGFVLANAHSTVAELGDEPFQIHTKFSKVAVAVDADRANGIENLTEKVAPDLILLDDAFQHRKVRAGLNILLTTYGKLYVDDWCLPTGNLRDSRREARRANIIVVTKCPAKLRPEERMAIQKRLKPRANQQLLFATLAYANEFLGKDRNCALSYFKDKKNVTLVTGIADPASLTEYLKAEGLTFRHRKYPDHHSFTAKELMSLNKEEVILTTEKDFVRLKDKVTNLFYIPIKHRFLNNDAEVLAKELTEFMKQNS